MRSVIKRDAVDTRQCREQLQVQIGIELQRLGLIITHRRFAFQGARSLPNNLKGHRRGHFEVFSVMLKDAAQIVTIPGGDPVGSEGLSKRLIDHETVLPLT